jgi:[acyl-carrier-protein] S-malonyltransferase
MKNIAFVFPGQGSQYVGMGESICRDYKIARNIFKQASDVCGYDILAFCCEGNYRSLVNSPKSLPALLTVTYAIYNILIKEIKITPVYFAGYSFGELSALLCSRAISFEDALKIAVYKSRLIQKVSREIKGAMIAVDDFNSKKLEKICKDLSTKNDYLNIAIYNSDKNTIVSGSLYLVKKLEKILQRDNIKLNRLAIETPFHSPYFKKDSFNSKSEINKYKIKKPLIPVISSLNAKILKNKKEIINSLSDHLFMPVNWSNSLDFLRNRVDTIVEVGPKKVLSSRIENFEVFSFSSSKDLSKIKENFSFTKKEIMGIMAECIKEAISVRNLNEDDVKYEIKVVVPCKKIQKRLGSYKKSSIEPELKDIYDSFLMLKSVLRGKLVEEREVKKMFKCLCEKNKKLQYFKEFKDICKIKK